MVEIVYSQTAPDLTEGQVYRNPRFYVGPEIEADSVRIFGDWPQIAGDYRVRGVTVHQMTPVTRPESPEIVLADAPEGWADPVVVPDEQPDDEPEQDEPRPQRRSRKKADEE